MAVLEQFPQLPAVDAMSPPPTHQEVAGALKALKNNKSPEPDGLPAETLKYEDNASKHSTGVGVGRYPKFIQKFQNSNKGERTVCGNSHVISLLSHAGKVLTKIMLKRLIAHVSKNILPETQCGFRSNKGTVDKMFVARQIQEKGREQNRPIYMAFDTINREVLWQLLELYGCPAKFVSILRQYHEGMETRVAVGGGESAPFKVKVGVKQGCVIAPVLFNLYIMSVVLLLQRDMQEYVKIQLRYRFDRSLFDLRKLQARIKSSAATILELQYADDCALVTYSQQAMQEVLNIIGRYYKAFRLSVNTDKTEVLYQPIGSGPGERQDLRVGR